MWGFFSSSLTVAEPRSASDGLRCWSGALLHFISTTPQPIGLPYHQCNMPGGYKWAQVFIVHFHQGWWSWNTIQPHLVHVTCTSFFLLFLLFFILHIQADKGGKLLSPRDLLEKDKQEANDSIMIAETVPFTLKLPPEGRRRQRVWTWDKCKAWESSFLSGDFIKILSGGSCRRYSYSNS